MKKNITLPKPIHVVLGKNPLRWPRACLLETMLNGGVFANLVSWSLVLVWVISVVDGIFIIIEWAS